LLYGILLLTILAAIGFLLYQKWNWGQPATQGIGASTEAIAVSLGGIHSTVRISGTVVAERSATIRAPRIMGSRGDVNRGGGGAHDHGPGGHPDFTLNLLQLAKAGTQVKAGDVVVEFDPETADRRGRSVVCA
jgi:multidrug efflux pump subunit AcrA (membrane-fusion protein)